MHGIRRQLTTQELMALEADGVELEFEEDPPLDLSQIEHHLAELAAKEPDNTAILQAVEALTKAVDRISVTVNPTDLKPILDAVRLIKREATPVVAPAPKPAAYTFDIVRDQRQLIESVTATPVTPTGSM
jgi:hypothetical protein